MNRRLQVLLPEAREGALVASLPSVLRSAHRAAEELEPAKIVFCCPDGSFAKRWRPQLRNLPFACANGEPAQEHLEEAGPLLVISPDGFPQTQALERFVAAAKASGRPLRWLAGERTVAAYYPQAWIINSGRTAAAVAAQALSAPAAAYEPPGPDWLPTADGPSAHRAEQALYARLPQDCDGYLARLDRRLSLALSRRLLGTAITPNMVTTACLVLGLLGAWWLSSGEYWGQLAGGLLLWLCCILDGCDGEIARLKLLCSRSGAAYDVAADNLVHLATFVAVPIGVWRAQPEAGLLFPGALLVSGFLASMLSVWWLILRVPEDRRGPCSLFIERIASRDYAYLILACVLLGRLDWFLWAAGLGSHLFWLSLWTLSLKRPAPNA